jgi:hypothetical protein
VVSGVLTLTKRLSDSPRAPFQLTSGAVMDSFLHIHSVYLTVSRWNVITRIYGESSIHWQATMWAMKVLFFIIAPFMFFAPSWHAIFFVLLAIAVIWGMCFQRARAEVFAELYSRYPEPMKYFARNYQYVRYLAFKKRLETDSLTERVKEALAFVDTLSNPRPRSPIMAHSLITFMLGAVLAILSGVAGQWPVKYVVAVLMILLSAVYCSCMILDAMRTPTSDLNEFRQFLQWIIEQPVDLSRRMLDGSQCDSAGAHAEHIASTNG